MSNVRYEYMQVKVQDEIATEAQNYDNLGWETVAVIPPLVDSHFSLLVKRPKPGYVLLSDEEYSELQGRAERRQSRVGFHD